MATTKKATAKKANVKKAPVKAAPKAPKEFKGKSFKSPIGELSTAQDGKSFSVSWAGQNMSLRDAKAFNATLSRAIAGVEKYKTHARG